jgi:acetoin utilization deacetylase AcuC-like enzyme
VAKYGLLRERLAATGLFELTPAPMAAREQIARAHEPAYVEAFLEGALDAKAQRRIGFPWSESLVRRTLASVGGTLAATGEALARGWGGNLAGGTHHAFRGGGAGYCVFNDIAVAIEHLRAEQGVRRAAVVDLDVHQGDGTAEIFEDDPGVYTLSLHGENNFPFHKKRSCVDVALPDGTGDDDYLEALRVILPWVFEFQPDMVFYQAGVDPLASDTLGRFALTPQGLAARVRMVMEAARQAGAPLVITLGGGYSVPAEITAAAHANTFLIAAEVFG